jgi:hypothetical protein
MKAKITTFNDGFMPWSLLINFETSDDVQTFMDIVGPPIAIEEERRNKIRNMRNYLYISMFQTKPKLEFDSESERENFLLILLNAEIELKRTGVDASGYQERIDMIYKMREALQQ